MPEGAIKGVFRDCFIDRASVASNRALDQSLISLVRRAFLELAGQRALRIPGSGKDHQSGCVHIKPVHSYYQAVAIAHDALRAEGLFWTSPGHAEKPAWFVDQNDLIIAMKGDDGLCGGRTIRARRWHRL